MKIQELKLMWMMNFVYDHYVSISSMYFNKAGGSVIVPQFQIITVTLDSRNGFMLLFLYPYIFCQNFILEIF